MMSKRGEPVAEDLVRGQRTERSSNAGCCAESQRPSSPYLQLIYWAQNIADEEALRRVVSLRASWIL